VRIQKKGVRQIPSSPDAKMLSAYLTQYGVAWTACQY